MKSALPLKVIGPAIHAAVLLFRIVPPLKVLVPPLSTAPPFSANTPGEPAVPMLPPVHPKVPGTTTMLLTVNEPLLTVRFVTYAAFKLLKFKVPPALVKPPTAIPPSTLMIPPFTETPPAPVMEEVSCNA